MNGETVTTWTAKGWYKINQIIINSEYDYNDGFVPWLQDNPHIWRAFANKAIEAVQSGRGYFGAQSIVEFIRWDTALYEDGISYKVNNNHSADLARLFMDCKPSMRGYFRIRSSTLRSDGDSDE